MLRQVFCHSRPKIVPKTAILVRKLLVDLGLPWRRHASCLRDL